MRTQPNKLISDRRGIAAVEFAIIATVMTSLLIPLTDIGIAAATYIISYQALRTTGAYAMYNPPPDLTNLSAIQSDLAAALPARQASTVCVVGDTMPAKLSPCPTQPTSSPRSFALSTTFTLTPLLFNVGCSGGCTVTYLQPFQ
jgi:Flp pilus assembly protein TadG